MPGIAIRNFVFAAVAATLLATWITFVLFHRLPWVEICIGMTVTITNGVFTMWIHYRSVHRYASGLIFYGVALNGCKLLVLFCILLLIHFYSTIEFAPFITVVFVSYLTFMVSEILALQRYTVERTIRK